MKPERLGDPPCRSTCGVNQELTIDFSACTPRFRMIDAKMRPAEPGSGSPSKSKQEAVMRLVALGGASAIATILSFGVEAADFAYPPSAVGPPQYGVAPPSAVAPPQVYSGPEAPPAPAPYSGPYAPQVYSGPTGRTRWMIGPQPYGL